MKLGAHPELEWAEGSRLIVITAHRRENLGEPMHQMFRAIRRIMDENPDVLEFSQVTGCDFDVDESRGEHKRQNAEGEYVSYIPPRYYWDYDFTMNIRVKHPYFDDMRFDLNGSSAVSETPLR